MVVVLPDPFRGMGGVEELNEPHKVWTRGQRWKYSAKNGAPERLRCGTIQEEVS